MKVSIKAKELQECPGVDIVAVVDRSGSMNCECSAADENGKSLENGFSVLDIVKHSVKTVIKTLRPQDRLSLIIYDDKTDVMFTLESMNEDGQNMALPIVDGIESRNSTDIYSALKEAVNIVQMREDKSRNPAIMLFTDGVPNRSPKEGEIVALQNLIREKQLSVPIHTFGFGYNLDSSKLYDMAKVSNSGMNNFIPDAGMVGTIFVNAISNILTTAAIDVKFKMNLQDKGIVNEMMVGDWNIEQTENELTVHVGSVRFGQVLEFLIALDNSTEIDIAQKIEYEVANKKFETQTISSPELLAEEQFSNELFRLQTVSVLAQSLKKEQENKPEYFAGFLQTTKDIPALQDNEVSKDLLANLEDQVVMALSTPQFFNKWGKHYLRSLLRALQMKIKNNFKDPAVEHFGGEQFEKFVEMADDIFVSMPPPTPTHKRPQQYNSGPIDMSQYHNRGGGCFGPESIVEMNDGSFKLIKNLVKGDVLKGGSKVVCLTKFFEKDGYSNICTLPNGLQITAWHPILHENEWKFPCQIVQPRLIHMPIVYNLVLDSIHIVEVNGTPAICLGHDYEEGILKHEYFGSQRVVDDLKKSAGWESGIVEIRSGANGAIKRNGGFNQFSIEGGDQMISQIQCA